MLATVRFIVFGLLGNAFFCVTLGLGFSILSGGLTLACMVLPILIHSVEEGLRSVPHDMVCSLPVWDSHAGQPSSTCYCLLHFLSLAAGLTLGIGRAITETAGS